MANDLSSFSELFLYVTFAGYGIYAALMICMVFFGRHPAVPLWFFEIYRHALRSFFWYALAVAVIWLCFFWLYLFGVLQIGESSPRGIFALFHDLGIRRGGGEIIYGSLALGSLLAFFGPLLPYALMNGAMGRRFKRRVLDIAARNLKFGQCLDFVSLRSRRSGFGPEIARLLVAANKVAMEWVTKTYSTSERLARRFRIDSFNQDRMKHTDGSRVVEFWESWLVLFGDIETGGQRKPRWRPEKTEIVFNGLCIRFLGVFGQRQMPRLIGTDLAIEGKLQQPIRTRRPSNWVADILGDGSHDSTLIHSQHYTLSDFQGNIVSNIPLEVPNQNLQYIGINNRDLYLFIHTGLSGNLFEFHVTEKVVDSIRLFEKDLAFVQRQIQSFEMLMNTNPSITDISSEQEQPT